MRAKRVPPHQQAYVFRPAEIDYGHRCGAAGVVRRLSRILLLDGSRALLGTHSELLARSRLYADLVGMWTLESPAT
jgi:ATP-binding cassette subfamily C protein